ncbi:MAG: hypothetical protein ACRBBW_20445 [Cellvibrionaceae bacterium]
MNRFISRQTEAANFTVSSKEQERQQIARQVAEFEQRQKKQRKGGKK